MDGVQTPDGRATGQISPTSWNLASTISLSNGFMMYSLAPACSARAICATSFSVVQNTTLGWSPPGVRPRLPRNSHVPVEQDRFRHRALADLQRLLTVLGFDDLEIEAFKDAPRDLSDHA